MNYQELLRSVPFEEIRPFIKKYHGDEKCIDGYKAHYELLCQLTPCHADWDEDFETYVRYYVDDEEFDPELEGENYDKTLLNAFPLETPEWETSLTREIIVADNVTAPIAEVVACCLWHSSFHAFTLEDRERTYKEWDDAGAEFYERYEKGELDYQRPDETLEEYLDRITKEEE